MHLYSGTSPDFIAAAQSGAIADELDERFFREFRYHAPESEVRAWTNSLSAMADVMTAEDLVDSGVLVEYQLPLTSRRLDCLITGRRAAGRAGAVIVELKQWERVAPSWIDDCVSTFVGARERDVLHPSAQVGNYRRYLLDTNTAFANGGIALEGCAYLHNFDDVSVSTLYADRFRGLLADHPAFVAAQTEALGTYLADRIGGGRGMPILDEILAGRFRPHKRLLEHAARMIRNEPAFVLLDEQQVALNAVLTKVREALPLKTVFLIKGGPGTGKSVIAANLVGALAAEGLVTLHATGSKAFTENLRKLVGGRASAVFKYFNSFAESEADSLDVLVCDEAHRIRDVSWNWRTPKQKRTDMSQVEELIRAARVSVFLIDDAQVVRPGEVGSSDLIRGSAMKLGIPMVEHELEMQFRCAGSEAFVSWVENTLDIRRTPDVLWDRTSEFDFDVVDSPEELEALVAARAAEGATARLTAGFCWPWSVPRPDGSLVADVVIGSWAMPWNARPDAPRLGSGIPKSSYWATDPNGLGQVGCVYTAQGFEYDFAGVIFGRDLVYRPGEGWIGQPEYSHDGVVKREARDRAHFTTLVKNAYRVLLTRGLRGCAVYFEDATTRDFVLSRVE